MDDDARQREKALFALVQECKCPICLEVFTNPRSGPCMHNFCEECIWEYIKDNHSECPTCRTPGVNRRSLHRNHALSTIADSVRVLTTVGISPIAVGGGGDGNGGSEGGGRGGGSCAGEAAQQHRQQAPADIPASSRGRGAEAAFSAATTGRGGGRRGGRRKYGNGKGRKQQAGQEEDEELIADSGEEMTGAQAESSSGNRSRPSGRGGAAQRRGKEQVEEEGGSSVDGASKAGGGQEHATQALAGAGAAVADSINQEAVRDLLDQKVESGGIAGGSGLERRPSTSSSTTIGSQGEDARAAAEAAQRSTGGGDGGGGGSSRGGAASEMTPRGKTAGEGGAAVGQKTKESAARTVAVEGGGGKRQRLSQTGSGQSPVEAQATVSGDRTGGGGAGVGDMLPSPKRLELGSAPPHRRPPQISVITMTGFGGRESEEIALMVQRMGSCAARLISRWDRTVTHLVCHTDASGYVTKRTLKYCMALLTGARIVSRAWLDASRRTPHGCAAPWEDYVVKGCRTSTSSGIQESHPLPPLEWRARHMLGGDSSLLSPKNLGGKHIYIVGPEGPAGGFTSRRELQDLLTLAGAVTKLGPPQGEDIHRALIVSILPEDKLQWRGKGAAAVSVTWVMDAVSNMRVPTSVG